MRTKITNDHVMCTEEFGYPLYIADRQCVITDCIDEAEIWDPEFDATKLKYIKAVTGYKELMFVKK